MYDSVYPSRTARFGAALVPSGVLRLKNICYREDFRSARLCRSLQCTMPECISSASHRKGQAVASMTTPSGKLIPHGVLPVALQAAG